MKIEDIEKKINISNFKYEGFNFWPLIKLKFIQKARLDNKINTFGKDKINFKKKSIFKNYKFFNSFFKYAKNKISKEK